MNRQLRLFIRPHIFLFLSLILVLGTSSTSQAGIGKICLRVLSSATGIYAPGDPKGELVLMTFSKLKQENLIL